MRLMFAAWLVLLFCPSVHSTIQAGKGYTFVVIVNKESQMTQLSVAKLKTIFLRRISRWPWGAEIYPVDLPEGSVLRHEFVREVLETTPAELGVYWIDQRATRNVGPPAVAPGAAAVKATVAAQRGGIGYIPALALDGTVKTLVLVQ